MVMRALNVDGYYPNEGLPPRPGEDRPGLSPFGRLAMGQTLGKSSILIYDNRREDVQTAGTDMVNLQGDDLDAQQLVLTLHPPRVIPMRFADVLSRLDQQNLTGEQTNAEVKTCDFPGDDSPIQWPPLEAVLEFGTGGVSTKVTVDYVNGVTLSATASFLRVRAIVTQGNDDFGVPGTSAAYYLAAHVGPGFATTHAQRTVFVGKVDNKHDSCVVDTPLFAKIARLTGCRAHHEHRQPVLTTGWIRFWQDPDGRHCVGDYFVANPQCLIPVPNGGLYFSVYNESGHEMKLSVIFQLAL